MTCLFCKSPSHASKSVEHVIPESLGNKEFILKRGIVCDKCNNYFANKIERHVLDIPFFKQYRHDLNIQNKKGRIPSKSGFMIDSNYSEVIFNKDKNRGEDIIANQEAVKELAAGGEEEIPVFIVTYGAPKNSEYVSKFLAKVGIEGLAYDAITFGYDESYFNQESLDGIKEYVRNAKKGEYWNYEVRQVHDPEKGFQLPNGENVTVICSWKFIITNESQLIFQFLFMGNEFSIDMLNPFTQNIHNWLEENSGRSPVLENAVEYIKRSK